MTFRIKTDYFQFIGKDVVLYSDLQKKLTHTFDTKRYINPIKLSVIVIIHQSNQKKLFCSSSEQLRR